MAIFFSGILLVGDSIEKCFAGDWVTFPIALIGGTGFPSAPASADCRARPDFLVDVKSFAASVVFFLLIRFG